jgi:predicted permease
MPWVPATSRSSSYGYWQRQFGGATDVVGRVLTLNSRPHQIVGVMPADFTIVDEPAEIVLPLRIDRSRLTLPGFGFRGVGRLKPGVTLDQASADIARLIPIWMRSWPAAAGVDPAVYEGWRIAPRLRPLKQDVVGGVERPLWLLLGTIVTVLVIACANVANLFLVQTEGRRSEFAVRAALGAGRRRLVRAVMAESLVLALAGGVLGVALSTGALPWLLALGPADLPRQQAVGLSPFVLAYTAAICLISGLLVGALPALRSTRATITSPPGTRFATEGREPHRTRRSLVVGQVALSVVLLIAAGLMLRSLQAMRVVQPGFTEPSHVHTMTVVIPFGAGDPDRVFRTQRDIVDGIATVSGVEGVGFASTVPMDGTAPDWDAVVAEGATYKEGEIPPFRLFKMVSPDFFRTMGTRVVAGREFSWPDLNELRPGVMVSEGLAREMWGSADAAIGKRIYTTDNAPRHEVIGVAEDVHESGVHKPAPATVYWPAFGQGRYRAGTKSASRTITIVIRSARLETEDFLREMRQAVWSVNSNMPIASQRTLQTIYAQSMARTSFTLIMLGIAAGMGLLLGVMGLYGAIAYDVSRRTREIGIRLALGAERRAVRQIFMQRGLALTVAGIAIGGLAAGGLTQLMSSLMFGVNAFDPATYGLVAAALAMTTLGTTAIAARRAAAVDPAVALKGE